MPRLAALIAPLYLLVACSGDEHGASADGNGGPDASPRDSGNPDARVSADDTGGDIVGAHVDFFAAEKASYVVLDGALGLSTVTVRSGGARCP